MKSSHRLLLMSYLALTSWVNLFAQQAEKKVLLTLRENEYPLYSESCFPLSMNEGKLYLVTNLGGSIYVYENDVMKGPYKSTSDAGINDCGEHRSVACAVVDNYSDDPSQYIRYTEDGKIMIRTGGKEYGPVGQIIQMAFSADFQKVSAIYMDENWNPFFFTPEGKIIQVEGEFTRLIISGSGKTAMVLMKGIKGMNMQDMEKISQMTPEEMMEWAKQMEGDNNNPAYYLYLSNGQKLGPYYFGGYSGDNPSFCITGGENWYMEQQSILYVNGMQVKDFENKSISLCDIWISADGRRYAALANYDELIFSDGQTYSNPLEINVKEESGKFFLSWLMLDEKNQLILFKKAI